MNDPSPPSIITLAFDASSPTLSIALIEHQGIEEKILYHSHQVAQRTDSSLFFRELEAALKESRQPNRIVVGVGPGSYNGLRSTIATAQGIASARNISLIGLPSAVAFKEALQECLVVGNARGGYFWLAHIREHRFLQEPQLLLSEALKALLLKHAALPLLSSAPILELPSSLAISIQPPEALILARLAHYKNSPSVALQPLYLKPPCVTVGKPKKN